MSKKIYNYEEAKPHIVNAVNMIANPVIQTLSPRGGNVMFEDETGMVTVTNDGVTIAKEVQSDHPLEDRIIDAIKFAALSSNREAGDGTTTATLLTKTAMFEGMRLLDNGISRLELKELLTKMRDVLIKNLEECRIDVEDDKQLYEVALISASGDEEIARNVVEVIKSAGQEGMVMIDQNHKPETVVKIEPGFLLKKPLAYRELAQNRGFASVMENVPVLVTDKRLYYEQEAETILTTAVTAGYKKLVIVAADFIGKTPNYLLANHDAGAIELILIKETDAEVLADLATYLGGSVVSEKAGSLVDNLAPTQFIVAEKVFANGFQSIFTSKDPDNEPTVQRIESLRSEIDSIEANEELKKRLASLTNGTVTVKVGGHSPLEIQERIARYDDSVRATRTAQKDGYVVGGGLTLLNLYKQEEWASEEVPMVKKFCEASVRQIAINSGKHADSILEQCEVHTDRNYYCGYDAKNDRMTDLLEAGVIDPYKVTEMAIKNSLSITASLLTSGYFIVNDNEKENE